MKRNFSISAISLAVLLLLGHSLFPHQHHWEREVAVRATQQTPQANGLVGALATIFSVDLGNDHLEAFLATDNTKFPTPEQVDAPINPAPITCFAWILHMGQRLIAKARPEPPPYLPNFNLLDKGRRAPPVVYYFSAA